jgi:hypothetical protein
MIPGSHSGSDLNAELIVLFTSKTIGMTVYSNLEHSTVGFMTTWIEATDKDCWEDFKGTVTLSND